MIVQIPQPTEGLSQRKHEALRDYAQGRITLAQAGARAAAVQPDPVKVAFGVMFITLGTAVLVEMLAPASARRR